MLTASVFVHRFYAQATFLEAENDRHVSEPAPGSPVPTRADGGTARSRVRGFAATPL